MHPLLEPPDESKSFHDDAESINYQRQRPDAGLDLEDVEDLAPLLNQFQNHLDSIRMNVEQVEGLDEHIARTSAALDHTFQGRVGSMTLNGI